MCRRPPGQAARASPARLGGTCHVCPRRLREHTPRFAEAQELHRSPPGPDVAPAVGARTDALKPAANRPAWEGRRRKTAHRPFLQSGARIPCLVTIGSKRSSSPFVSFPAQCFEIADVSLIEGTIAVSNYSFFFASPRNRTQEADGSIPFSSTKAFRFFFNFG